MKLCRDLAITCISNPFLKTNLTKFAVNWVKKKQWFHSFWPKKKDLLDAKGQVYLAVVFSNNPARYIFQHFYFILIKLFYFGWWENDTCYPQKFSASNAMFSLRLIYMLWTNLVNSLFISDKEVLSVFFLKTVVTSFLKFERFFLFLLLDDYLQLKPRWLYTCFEAG